MEFGTKYLVIKLEDIENGLTEFQKDILLLLLTRIREYRKTLDKKDNEYLVINRDEDYARTVEYLMDSSEKLKKLIKEVNGS